MGDTEGILNMLTDPILSKKRTLFEKESYALFLKKVYGNAILYINKIENVTTDKSSVDVEIDFNDGGSPLKTKFILLRDGGIWKISEEVTDF